MQHINIKLYNYLLRKNIIPFIIKIVMIWILATSLLMVVENKLKNYELNESVRLYMKGFITNPEVLYLTYQYYCNKGNYKRAKEDINIAGGISKDAKFVHYKNFIENDKCNQFLTIKK